MCAWTIERWYWEQNARICIVQTCGGRITSISCAKLINITTIFIYGLNIHIETRCHYGYYTITIIVLKSSCSLWPLFHTLQRVPISKNVESACGNLFPHIKQITFSILFGSHALRLHLIESAQNTHTHLTDYNTIQYFYGFHRFTFDRYELSQSDRHVQFTAAMSALLFMLFFPIPIVRV